MTDMDLEYLHHFQKNYMPESEQVRESSYFVYQKPVNSQNRLG